MQSSVDSGAEASPPADRRRRLWAQSKDSMWQSASNPDQDQDLPQDLSPDPGPGGAAANGRVPNKISSWLSECRTPLGASLDEHSPSRGLRNGCSFEDDLSLGAEANLLQSGGGRTEPGFGLAADQKRTQFKERAQSMNSTGSGKSSTVSSVSELLDLYEEDPEEILLNLGFGREEPDLASKVPARFFNNSSCANGIDFKVFLGAQLQRLEVENPNYALTSRFRQIEVLTTVANEFFQLYSQVSGQPLHRITPRDPGGQSDGKDLPLVKKSASALNAAKLLKKTISRHNLLANANAGASANAPDTSHASILASAQANGQASAQANLPANEQANGDAPTKLNVDANTQANTQANIQANTQASTHANSAVAEGSAAAEDTPRAKLKMDTSTLATVSEEGSSESEDAPSPSSKPANQREETVEMTNGRTDVEHTANHSAGEMDLDVVLSTNSRTEEVELSANHSTGSEQLPNEDTAEVTANSKTEAEGPSNETVAADRAVHPQLALLRSENTDSFDIEEIHSSEDDVLPLRGSRNADLSRTVSQQSDSSGFAEEPSSESCSFLKVQESSDSCDSETTVTSHPSQDLATPLATDQPAFVLLSGGGEVTGGAQLTEVTEDRKEEEQATLQDATDVIPQYSVHHLPKKPRTSPVQPQQSTSLTEPHPETIDVLNSELEGRLDQTTSEDTPETPGSPFSDATFEDKRSGSIDLEVSRPRALESPDFLSDSSESLPPAPPSPVLSALHRAKLHHKPAGGRGRLHCVPLQRSSSLPTTVVSSVRIQLGRRGKDPRTPPQPRPPRDDPDGYGARRFPTTPLKAIPPHLMASSRSVCSGSPPPDWQTGSASPSWSTQSFPEVFAQQNFPPLASYPQVPPHSYPFASVYGSLPNLSSVQPPYPHAPPHSGFPHRPEPHPAMNFAPGTPHPSVPWLGGSYSSLHSPQNPNSFSQYSNMSHLPHGTPAPSMSSYGSYPHLHHPGPLPPQPGFHLTPPSSSLYGGHPFGPMFAPEAAFPPHPTSSSEMQLRRVLQEIRGTLHSLGQGGSEVLSQRRAAPVFPQTLSELMLKRRSLNAFRSQMMELELSIVREQAQVYRHLSPSDRLEVEQLQRLRTAVREELQELEQQLEERLLELTPPEHMVLQSGSSEDNLSSASALRAMQPVSDLLREQLLLQSELSYHSNSSASSRCSSPIRRTPTPGTGVYRASINLTPVPPPRPGAESPQPRPSEDQRAGPQETEDTPTERGQSQETTATPPADELQQLIREIRQSVVQEVRREIYNELLASMSPSNQPPL